MTNSDERVTLGLPSKGALASPTLEFLSGCGMKVKQPNTRQYTANIPIMPRVDVVFQRVNDIILKVVDGTLDLGITGLDVVAEHTDPESEVIVVYEDLQYGGCRLVLAVPEAWLDVETVADLVDVALDFREQKERNLRVATKYPNLTRSFLTRHGLAHFTLVSAEGAMEAAPAMGYADIICDITATGTTLRENNLRPLADGTVIDSQACLVGNSRRLHESEAVLQTALTMLEYIEGAVASGGRYMVEADVPAENAARLAEALANWPGTVILPATMVGADGPWFTVKAEVGTRELLALRSALHAQGGQTVLVTPMRYRFAPDSESKQRFLGLLKHE
jgi:ATP phosphoribosyltransferase